MSTHLVGVDSVRVDPEATNGAGEGAVEGLDMLLVLRPRHWRLAHLAHGHVTATVDGVDGEVCSRDILLTGDRRRL